MKRWFKSLFADVVVHEDLTHVYYENAITGRRRAKVRGIQPKRVGLVPNRRWLAGGEWLLRHPAPAPMRPQVREDKL